MMREIKEFLLRVLMFFVLGIVMFGLSVLMIYCGVKTQ